MAPLTYLCVFVREFCRHYRRAQQPAGRPCTYCHHTRRHAFDCETRQR